jgi:hypothetical protein
VTVVPLTPAEFAAVAGGQRPGGSGKVCTATFDGYQANGSCVVSGFGMSGRYSGLVNFWKESAKARKRASQKKKTIGDVFRSAKVPPSVRRH